MLRPVKSPNVPPTFEMMSTKVMVAVLVTLVVPRAEAAVEMEVSWVKMWEGDFLE